MNIEFQFGNESPELAKDIADKIDLASGGDGAAGAFTRGFVAIGVVLSSAVIGYNHNWSIAAARRTVS